MRPGLTFFMGDAPEDTQAPRRFHYGFYPTAWQTYGHGYCGWGKYAWHNDGINYVCYDTHATYKKFDALDDVDFHMPEVPYIY